MTRQPAPTVLAFLNQLLDGVVVLRSIDNQKTYWIDRQPGLKVNRATVGKAIDAGFVRVVPFHERRFIDGNVELTELGTEATGRFCGDTIDATATIDTAATIEATAMTHTAAIGTVQLYEVASEIQALVNLGYTVT
jgi:hypothetical protein